MSKHIYSQRSFLGGVVPSYSLGDPEDPKRQHALGWAQNMIVTQRGALTRAPGSLYGFTLPDETQTARLVPFETADAKFLLVFQPGVIHFYKDVNGTFTRIVDTGWTIPDVTDSFHLYPSLPTSPDAVGDQMMAFERKDQIAITHGMGPVRLTTTGTLDSGLATGTDYYVFARTSLNLGRIMPYAPPTHLTIVNDAYYAFEGESVQAIAFSTSIANLDNWIFTTLNADGSGDLTIKLNTASNYYQLPNSYSASDLENIQYSARGNLLVVSDGAHPPLYIYKPAIDGHIAQTGDDKWRIIEGRFNDGPLLVSEASGSSTDGLSIGVLYPPGTGDQMTVQPLNSLSLELGKTEKTPVYMQDGDTLLAAVEPPTSDPDDWYALVVDTYYTTKAQAWCYLLRNGPSLPPGSTQHPVTYWSVNAYSLNRGWPYGVANYEGRTWFGGGGTKPWQVYGSSLSKERSFLPFEFDMTVTANTAITLDPFRDTDSGIVSVAALDELIVASDDAIWAFGPTDYSTAMAATNVTATRISDVGAARTNMAATRNALAYISADRRRIFLISSLAKTGVRGYDYKTLDLTEDWPTLFSGDNKQAKRIVFQTKPEPIIWVQRDDGTMASCSIDPERGMKAWTEHTTAAVEDLAVMTSDDGSYQAVYRLMNRTINGGTHRYVEYQRSNRDGWTGTLDSVFTESSVEYSGVAITVVTGLGHLEGETVYVRQGSNGGIGEEFHTVASGQITLVASQTDFVLGLVRHGAWIYHEPIVQFPNGWSSGSMLMLRELRMQVASSRDGSYWANGDILAHAEIDYPSERSTWPIYTGWVSVRPGTNGLDASRNVWLTGPTMPFTMSGAVMVVEATEAFGQR